MGNIISLLENLASDASLLDDKKLISTIESSDITEEQQQALLTKNVDLLKEVSQDIPTIECFAILPAEDDDAEESEEDQESSDKSSSLKLAVNT